MATSRTPRTQQARLTGAGLAGAEEREITCCYAKQDKFWVRGAPDGESWEIYTMLADSQTFYGEGHGPACCGGTGCHTEEAGEPAATAAKCCWPLASRPAGGLA